MTSSFSRFALLTAHTMSELVERLNACQETFNVLSTFKEHDYWYAIIDRIPMMVMVDDAVFFEETDDTLATHTLSA